MTDDQRATVERTPRKRRLIRAAAVAAVLMIPVAGTAACGGAPCTPRGESHICN